MRLLPLLLSAGLTACATSPAGLARTDLEVTVPSAKTAQQFATCVAERLLGNNNDLRGDGDRHWILRFNSYGVPVVRWDFIPLGAGSRAELRTTRSIGLAAVDKVRGCA